MKVKSDFVINEIGDEFVVVPVEARAEEFHGMVRLNDTGAFLWKLLEQETTEADMVKAVLADYEISEADAGRYVDDFVKKMEDAGLLA